MIRIQPIIVQVFAIHNSLEPKDNKLSNYYTNPGHACVNYSLTPHRPQIMKDHNMQLLVIIMDIDFQVDFTY